MPDQVAVVLLQEVDVLGGLAEEAGAVHRRGADQARSDHRDEAGRGGLRHRHVDQGQLQQGADAGQVVGARAGHLGAALGVDRAEDLAQLDVVLGLEALGREVARGADLLQRDEVLLAADRGRRVDQVRQRADQALGRVLRLVLLGVGGLDLLGQGLGALEQSGLLLALGLGDLLAQALLLVAQLVETGAGGPAPFVGGEQGVDQVDVLATGALGGAHSVRVLTKQAKVNHGPQPTGAGAADRNRFCAAGAERPAAAASLGITTGFLWDNSLGTDRRPLRRQARWTACGLMFLGEAWILICGF